MGWGMFGRGPLEIQMERLNSNRVCKNSIFFHLFLLHRRPHEEVEPTPAVRGLRDSPALIHCHYVTGVRTHYLVMIL